MTFDQRRQSEVSVAFGNLRFQRTKLMPFLENENYLLLMEDDI